MIQGRIPGQARRLAFVLLVLLVLLPLGARGGPAPAPGGGPLLETAETASATVVGRVGPVEVLDVRGYAAPLVVERTLTGSLDPGATIRIGWDEFAKGRAPRFPEGSRILVALVPLPGGSLWRSRFPDGRALAVGSRSKAFLRDPDAASVDALARYLTLSGEARSGSLGADALLVIAADAHPVLARAALERLAGLPDLDAKLTDAGRSSFAILLTDGARPRSLQRGALDLAGGRRLASLRPEVASLAVAGSPLEAPALSALARIDGGLSADEASRLLKRPEGEIRAVVVRHGGPGISDARIETLLQDPAPQVRGAAVETLTQRRGAAALEESLPLLFDGDDGVRRSAAVAVGAMGSPAVPSLRELVEQRPFQEPSELSAAVAALALTGPDGQRALADLHARHPDPRVRKLVGLALGKLPGDTH